MKVRCSPPKRARGFTLIEVLLVVAIMGVLAALVVPQLASRQEQANVDATRLSVSGIEQALRLYAIDHSGKLPPAHDGLVSLVEQGRSDKRWKGPYLETLPLDAWGQTFRYEVAKTPDGRSVPQLRSIGPDGIADTEDDITNDK